MKRQIHSGGGPVERWLSRELRVLGWFIVVGAAFQFCLYLYWLFTESK
jgi:hypothetical protein